jgi:hypothetical protein
MIELTDPIILMLVGVGITVGCWVLGAIIKFIGGME